LRSILDEVWTLSHMSCSCFIVSHDALARFACVCNNITAPMLDYAFDGRIL